MDKNQETYIELSILTQYHQYQALEFELKKADVWQSTALLNKIHLTRAILNTNLKEVERLANCKEDQVFVAGTVLERKVYYALQNMTLQLAREEYNDYLRGLTPLLVDLLRIIIERDFMPNLSEYMIPISKSTPITQPIYRGMQWSREKITADDNLIHQTWKKYYGDEFNYDHYVSSSHLIKLIETHASQPKLIELTLRLRRIEKYLRNIVAHEVMTVDRQFFRERMATTPEEVHQTLLEVYREAQLNDEHQLDSVMRLRQEIHNELTKQYERIKEQ